MYFTKRLLASTALTRAGAIALGIAAFAEPLGGTVAYANPAGGQVVGGSAAISQSGSELDITQSSSRTVIDWQSFSIGAGETTRFIQPGASSIAVNRVTGVDPSQILGKLTANGQVVLVNPNGILFGKGAQVNVGGLVASTAGITTQNAMAGTMVFDQLGQSGATIENDGRITARSGGLVALVAPNVINNGVISAKLGKVSLSSGDKWTLDLYGDNLVNFDVTDQVNGAVTNSGIIKAGTIAITANAAKNIVGNAINMGGIAEATSIHQDGGTIVLDGGNGNVTISGALLAAGSTGGTVEVTGNDVALSGALVDASGTKGGGTIEIGGGPHGSGTLAHASNVTIDADSILEASAWANGNGGSVTVWSDGTTQFYGNIFATGGALSGNGGTAETSGHGELVADGYVDLTAANGQMGTYLLDPTNITIYGNVTPAFNSSAGVTDGTQVNLSSSLQLWLDAADASSITLTYNNLGTTASGTIGNNTITVGSNANLVVGERIQLGTSATQLASINDASNIYTITAISGTSITLDANLAATATGAALYGGYASQVVDKSGSGNTFTQPIAADMPLWVSNGQNGQGTFLFNGTSDFLSAPVINTQNANTSIFLVSTPNSVSDQGATFKNGNENTGYGIGYGGTEFDNNGNNFIELYEQIAWHVASVTYGTQTNLVASILGSASAQNYLNGNAIQTIGGIPNNPTLTTFFGGYDASSGGGAPRFFGGTIPELLFYNTALSTNAQALANQYQSAQWNVALSGPGVIGSETGLTGVEAQAAMASVQAGATTDGYSVFSASYLTRLSQTSNVILQAGNNINLDLQGATLSLAAGKNITLTAGNQILTDSTGGITTAQSGGTGGNIAFNATNGIVFNNTFALNSGGGAIALNNATTLNAPLTIVSSGGGVSFAGTVDGAHGLIVNSGTGGTTFDSDIGTATALGAVNVTGPATLYGNVTTGNAAITFNGAVDLAADSTMSSGTATTTLNTIDGDHNLTVTAATVDLDGTIGGATPLAALAVTSTNTLALPSISAASIFAKTTGATSDISIGPGDTLTASGSGTSIALVAGRNFINDGGAGALSTPNGRWLVYSTNPANNTLDGLSANFDRYSCAYMISCPAFAGAGNGLLYGYTPTLTVTPYSLGITYDNAAPDLTGYVHILSGYIGSDESADTVTGTLNGTTNYIQGDNAGSYAITYSNGLLTSALGYTFNYVGGTLTVAQAPLTITANSASRMVGQADPIFSASYSGLVNGDAATVITGLSFAANDQPSSPAGLYQITPYGGSATNYSISYVAGPLTITALPDINTPQIPQGNSAPPASIVLAQVVDNQIFEPLTLMSSVNGSDNLFGQSLAQIVVQSYGASEYSVGRPNSDAMPDQVVCLKSSSSGSAAGCASITLRDF